MDKRLWPIYVLVLSLLVGCSPTGQNTGTEVPASESPMPPTASATQVLPTLNATSEPLPVLQPIMVENADRIELLRSMSIPGYQKGQISQCSLAFSPDGRLLVGACGKNQVPVWEVQSGLIRHLLYDRSQQIVACVFSPGGGMIACGGFDKTITLWNAETGAKIREVGSHASPVWELGFGPDGQKLASCSLSSDVRLWDVGRGEMVWSYAGTGAFLSVSFSPSGRSIAYGGRWGSVGVLDAATGQRSVEIEKLSNPIGDVTYSPSGRLLAAGTDDNEIYLWNTEQYQRLAILKGHRHYVNGVAFSPDERLLASGSHDKTVGIWDVAGQKLLKMLDGHTDAVLRVAFSPDGKLIASISWDGTLRLWGVR